MYQKNTLSEHFRNRLNRNRNRLEGSSMDLTLITGLLSCVEFH